MSNDLRWITSRLALAIAKLQTHDPDSQREAANDIVSAQIALWDLLDLSPKPGGIGLVLDDKRVL
jgi:hypothetical protein